MRNLTKGLLKWVLISMVVGGVGGIVGTLFVISVNYANYAWTSNNWLVFLLPLGGLLIVALYKIGQFKEIKGTNRILDHVRNEDELPIIVAPLIFVSTFITHILGGSSGREGAAVQLGGALGSGIGKLFRLNNKDMSLVVLAGVSAVFAALFETPIAATFFALEVVSVGVIYYSGLVPCVTASLVGYSIAKVFKVNNEDFSIIKIPSLDIVTLLKVILVGLCCAGISVIFIISIDFVKKSSEKLVKSPYLRIFIGGIVIIGLSLIFSSGRYNGSGAHYIITALEGEAAPWDFLVKIVFTAITLGVGFKGGEIVPVFFVGATFGCVLGGVIGLDPGFAAGIALVATFCGAVNCPIASIFLGIELFGGEGLIYYMIACSTSYLMSGYYSLYGSQKIMYSKITAEYINKKAN